MSEHNASRLFLLAFVLLLGIAMGWNIYLDVLKIWSH